MSVYAKFRIFKDASLALHMPTLGFPNIYSIFAYTQVPKDATLCVPILWSLKMLLYNASIQISKDAPTLCVCLY